MQGLNSPTQRLNLTSQIQLRKNYQQHRRRLDVTRYRSPLMLKKSLSFDQQKSLLFNELRTRKTYTNDFKRREQSRIQEENDAVMLRRILEYDRRLFVFSLADRTSSPLLHHNSRVNHCKTSSRIDAENEKIHFRITKARSQYSKEQLGTFRQSGSVGMFGMRREGSQGRLRDSAQKLLTQGRENEEEEGDIVSKVLQIEVGEVGKIRDVMRMETETSKGTKERHMSKGVKLLAISNMAVCDRIRKERLASKLYERKIRFQNSIGSTLFRRK